MCILPNEILPIAIIEMKNTDDPSQNFEIFFYFVNGHIFKMSSMGRLLIFQLDEFWEEMKNMPLSYNEKNKIWSKIVITAASYEEFCEKNNSQPKR